MMLRMKLDAAGASVRSASLRSVFMRKGKSFEGAVQVASLSAGWVVDDGR
jgi:hypothetical protein